MKNKAVDYFSLRHPLRKPASLVALCARKKMFSLFMKIMQPDASSLILDAGVTPDNTLPDSNYFEKFYPHRERIFASSIEDASFLTEEYPGLCFVRTEKCSLPFKDMTFDIVICSAVLEHVGNRENQKKFIRELLRVSRRFFITTPNRQFPVEFHTFLPFIHWFPRAAHQKILRMLHMEFWSRTENLNLLSPSSLLSLFPESIRINLIRQHLFGLPSNLIVYGKSSYSTTDEL
jgi:SAM-dependent methyltransferase